MRVVFEKPLGRDFESARDLTTSLRQWFSDDELYLVDHYLCKAAVRQILSFRWVAALTTGGLNPGAGVGGGGGNWGSPHSEQGVLSRGGGGGGGGGGGLTGSHQH